MCDELEEERMRKMDTYYEDLASELKKFIVYGVGRHSDNLPRMDKEVIAKNEVEARAVFNTRYPEYRAIEAYEINK